MAAVDEAGWPHCIYSQKQREMYAGAQGSRTPDHDMTLPAIYRGPPSLVNLSRTPSWACLQLVS